MRRGAMSGVTGALIAAAFGLTGCSGSSDPPAASPPTSVQLAATCTALSGTRINDVTITSTKWFEASGGTPSFCQVNGTRAPFLDIEVDVPDSWSGRLWQQGGGGLDGVVRSAITIDATSGAVTDINIALKTGRSVYAASNGGNRSSEILQKAPVVWADGTVDGTVSAKDYAYEALNTTREFAKAMTKTFYGKLPDHTYFNGCSNGGRNAYIAADRWPKEYDGIVSGCMGMDLTGQTAAWMNYGSRVGTPSMPSNELWKTVTAAAVAACDALDGVTDGIIAHPSACQFDVSTLQCGSGANCLTAAQVQTVKDIMADVKLANGTTVYSGFTWGDWSSSIQGWALLGGGNAILATGDLTWFTSLAKQQSFNINNDYLIFQYGLRLAGADPDKSKVAAFVASGRKLISWHDGADSLVSANDHIRNYSAMTVIAKSLVLKIPSDNTRFFVVPGGIHAEGQALTEVDWFTAITNWVENNSAPEQLLFNKIDITTGSVVRTLPVCQHPDYPKYNGSGDVNLAANYVCTTP